MTFNQTNNNAGQVNTTVSGVVKKCGTCKFWGNKKPDENPTFKQCTAIVHDKGYRVAPGPHNAAFEMEADDPELAAVLALREKTKAVVQDGSGFHAALKVREDFGCVLHEEA